MTLNARANASASVSVRELEHTRGLHGVEQTNAHDLPHTKRIRASYGAAQGRVDHVTAREETSNKHEAELQTTSIS